MSANASGGSYLTRFVTLVVLLSAASSFAFARGSDNENWPQELRLSTLSTKPEVVSGGDVLVRVDVPAHTAPEAVRVELNGADVTGVFAPDASEGSLTGLVSGLRIGQNVLVASAGNRGKGEGQGRRTRLTLTNHPITGPIFSGPHQAPFICETENFVLPVTGDTLGVPLDPNCSVTTRVDYVYMSTAGMFRPLPDPTVRPADLAQTTTSKGRTVNYIARVETGTINRAVYQIAMLHDPVLDPSPDVRAPSAGWNGRLVYSFGGGCNAGYHQGRATGGTFLAQIGADAFISRGYAVASSSLTVFGNKCDDVISAETMMMVKERFIERFGEPRHTIGTGASGGSMQQHLIAHNYPGLLDGIQPSYSFSDTLSFSLPYLDCGLLDRAFNTSSLPWTEQQKAAVAGHSTYEYCTRNATWWYRFVDPRDTCDPSLPAARIYHPITNPDGVRCTLADDMVNVYGRDPRTGFARRLYDNTGIQYGLNAFIAGDIGAEQFLDLNERIGGYDIDGEHVPARMGGDAQALRTAYRTGRINSGGAGIASVPIIDFRSHVDHYGDVHDTVRTYVTRARLIAANGHADNHVILVAATLGTILDDITVPDSPFHIVLGESLRLMDEWLDNIKNDNTPHISAAEKVRRNKPAELVDACYTVDGVKIDDPATCRSLFPPVGNPRLAAGEPLTNDYLKCRLKPARMSDYPPLTDAQFERLQGIFPNGVCDYSRPPVGRMESRTWLAYPEPGKAVRLEKGSDRDARGWH